MAQTFVPLRNLLVCKNPSHLGTQFKTRDVRYICVVDHLHRCSSLILLYAGLTERSHCMTVKKNKRQRARQSAAKKKQKLEEVESETSRLQSTPCNTRGAEATGKHNKVKKTSIVKLLCHAILVLGKGCNTSLMSANFSELLPHTLHALTCLKICPLQ